MAQKMDKRFLVSFLIVASVFVLATTAVRAEPSLGTITTVQVNSVDIANNPAISVGDNAVIRVDFSSLVNAQNVAVTVELDGNTNSATSESQVFDVESGFVYTKSLSVNVPFDLQNSLSDFATLTVKISGDGYRTETTYDIRVQRQSYSAVIQSVNTPQSVNAGQLFPVNFVLQNQGYNNLEDLYVTASIPALGIEQTSYVGDLVSVECNKDATAQSNYGVNITRNCNQNSIDTASGTVFLQLPWDIKTGTYALEFDVKNGDTTASQTAQVNVANPLSTTGNFIVSDNQLLIVNPTNQVVVYRFVPETTNTVPVTLSENLVAVPAGSSKTITTSVPSGSQNYYVDAFGPDGSLLERINFTTGTSTSGVSPIAIITVILAIIFIVLLVVLIVLIGKKPEKAEEFGESYY